MKAVMICDHSLDPRLRKRVQWLKDMGYDVSIYTDSSRGKHFSSSECPETPLSDLKLKTLISAKLVYISGAKVILSKFNLIRKISQKKTKLIYEIPDLPLRKHSSIQNYLIMHIFSFIVNILFKNIVVTSNAFIEYLPKNKNYILCENLPPESLITKKTKKSITLKNKQCLTIGFVGALRYPQQMLMLIRFCVENKHNAVFYGGPEENKINLISMCNDADLDISSYITFHGSYNQNNLESIYKEIDFVYSVYDAKQPNVKLALPNKLYESQLFLTPIIVASNTYLSDCVRKLNVGFSVNSIDYEIFAKNMKVGLQSDFEIDSSDVIENILSAKENFTYWIKEI